MRSLPFILVSLSANNGHPLGWLCRTCSLMHRPKQTCVEHEGAIAAAMLNGNRASSRSPLSFFSKKVWAEKPILVSRYHNVVYILQHQLHCLYHTRYTSLNVGFEYDRSTNENRIPSAPSPWHTMAMVKLGSGLPRLDLGTEAVPGIISNQ